MSKVEVEDEDAEIVNSTITDIRETTQQYQKKMQMVQRLQRRMQKAKNELTEMGAGLESSNKHLKREISMLRRMYDVGDDMQYSMEEQAFVSEDHTKEDEIGVEEMTDDELQEVKEDMESPEVDIDG